MQRRLLPFVCGALLLALAGCGGSAPVGGHGILFLRARGRVQQIFLWRPGSSARQVGPAADFVESPTWAPDGKSIAFADEAGGWDDPETLDVYVMRANGTKVRRVTVDAERPGVFRADEPSWSPAGTRIVFVRELGDGPRLATVAVRSGRETTLPARGEEPAWGKAGIAYVSDYRRIMLLRPTVARPRVLARTHSLVDLLAWSSHGVLAALENRNRVVLYSASGRRVGQFVVPAKARGACGMAWSRDGVRLVLQTGGSDRGFWTTTAIGGRWRRLPIAAGPVAIGGCAVSWR